MTDLDSIKQDQSTTLVSDRVYQDRQDGLSKANYVQSNKFRFSY
jgi:hypothetical protein